MELKTANLLERLAQELWGGSNQARRHLSLDVRLRPHGGKGRWPMRSRRSVAILQSDRTSASSSGKSDQAAANRRRRRTGPSTGSTSRLFRLRRSSLGHSRGTGAPETTLRQLVEPGKVNVKYARRTHRHRNAAQYLQVMHGQTPTSLRTPNTLQHSPRW